MERQGMVLGRGNSMVDWALTSVQVDSSGRNHDDLRALWSRYRDGPRSQLRALGAHATISPW
jgi:hypothetical protein